MSLLLDLGYLLCSVLLSPWLLYRFIKTSSREELAMRLGSGLGPPLESSVWLHGSSAGEVSLLKPLVARLERDLPGTPLVISAFTATGLAAARRLYPQHRVVTFPFDLSFIVRRFLTRFDPQLVVIVESEFWPNFILQASRQGVPVAVVNGKMSEKSHRLHARTRLVPRVLRELALIATQTEEHAERLRSLGVAPERIRVTGNMKYDLAGVAANPRIGQELRERLGYGPGDVVVIGGSLHEREDEALLDAFAAARHANDATALILVPRYPAEAATVCEHVRARGLVAVRKTEVDAGAVAPGRGGVLVVDTVGELGQLYGVADIAFVGGSLFYRGSNKGGHNLMEPAILGVPVLFGPYNFSFKETVEDLLAADAGIRVADPGELRRALTELVVDGSRRAELGGRGARVVREGQGAAARNYELLIALLGERRPQLQPTAFDRKMPRALSGSDSL